MIIKFSDEKNSKLPTERRIGFEQISNLITEGKFFTIEDRSNKKKYPSQKIIYVPIGEEIYAVPCVLENDGTFFLKTIFPSRKARKKFLKKIKSLGSVFWIRGFLKEASQLRCAA
jgi:hypothetical protein